MDTLLFGLSVAAIGILIVFCGLIILIGLIKTISMTTAERKTKKVAPVAAPAVVAPAVEEASSADVQDDALIAAITAAIAACIENGASFTVRHVKRVTNANPWQRAGREEQVYSRM